MAAGKKQQNISMGDIDNLQKFADIKYSDENYSETISDVPSIIQRGTIYLIAIAIVVTGVILFLGKSSQMVTAQGKIITVGGDYKITASNGGELIQILAKEGGHFKKGDTILVLNGDSKEDEPTKIIMPVDGQIIKMIPLHTGQYITRNTEIATIQPDDSPLIVEAYIRNREIALVKEGQPVQIKVDAYSFQQFGTLNGKVKSILPDVTAEAKFKITIELLTDHFKTASGEMKIFAGLTVIAEIETGKQRLINMIFNSGSEGNGE